MDLADKIKQIQIAKNLTPSIFADEIGVQRASISHILAGRNKPSLDIVQKIVKRFPDLGLNWILDGENLPDFEEDPTDLKSTIYIANPAPKELPQPQRHLHTEVAPAQSPVQSKETTIISTTQTEKKVERIILFYSDGTFQEMKP